MSSPSDGFECLWQPSPGLLRFYLAAQGLALLALWQLDIPGWVWSAGMLLCMGHAALVLPRDVLLNRPRSFRGLRHGCDGWQVWSARSGWQAAQISGDSLALPLVIILRFRLNEGRPFGWLTHSVCIPRDALAPDVHRRLRVLLRFARRT